VIQAAQPGANQPHVVVQGQPADKDIGGIGPHRVAHGADVGQQIGVGQDDALGLAGAARGVLKESDVLRPNRRAVEGSRADRQLLRRDHLAQGVDLSLKQTSHPLRLRRRDQQDRLGVGENPGMATQVILELRRAQRGVDGDRDATGQQDTEKAEQVVTTGGQHDGHALAGQQSARLQTSGQGPRPIGQRRVGDRFGFITFAVQVDMGALRMIEHMPVEHLRQRPGRVRHPRQLVQGCDWGLRCGRGTAHDFADLYRLPQVAGRLGTGQQLFRQADAEGAFQAQQQLHP